MKRIIIVVIVLLMLMSLTACNENIEESKHENDTEVEETPEPTPEPTSEPTPEPTPEPLPVSQYTELGCINIKIPNEWKRKDIKLFDTIHFGFEEGHVMLQADPGVFTSDWWNEWIALQEGGIFLGEYVNQRPIKINGADDAMYAECKLTSEGNEYYETLVVFMYKDKLYTVSMLNSNEPADQEKTEAFDAIIKSIYVSGEYDPVAPQLFSEEPDFIMEMLSPLILINLPPEFEVVDTVMDDDMEHVERIYSAYDGMFLIVSTSQPNEDETIPDASEMQTILNDSISENFNEQGFIDSIELDTAAEDGRAYSMSKAVYQDDSEYIWFEYYLYEPEFICNIWLAGPYQAYEECEDVFAFMMLTTRLSYEKEE